MKESLITFRDTNGMKEQLVKEANVKKITVSEVIRRKLDNYQDENTEIRRGKNWGMKVCNLMTEIQKLKIDYPEIDIEKIIE